MSFISLPKPDSGILSRRNQIVRDLEQAIGTDRVVSDEIGRRAYETDALTAYRQMPLAVLLHVRRKRYRQPWPTVTGTRSRSSPGAPGRPCVAEHCRPRTPS